MPAHITLLYPFLPPEQIDESTLAELRQLLADEPAFDFELSAVERFQPSVLYLAPRPAEPFVRLMQLLFARYPEAPPYGGAFDTVVPHLTVAQGADPLVRDAISAELQQALPVPARAREVWLMESGEDGCWRFRAGFALTPDGPASGTALTR